VPSVTEYRAEVERQDPSPAGGIDARGDRLMQGSVGVLLLAAFVFGIPLLVPIVGVVLAVGAAIGPRANPLHLAFARFLAPRLTGSVPLIDPQTVRRQDALIAGLCAIATIGFGLGIAPVGWLVVIVAAIVAIFAATTRIHLGDQLRRFTAR
jgi:uncharacterized protein DUF4395